MRSRHLKKTCSLCHVAINDNPTDNIIFPQNSLNPIENASNGKSRVLRLMVISVLLNITALVCSTPEPRNKQFNIFEIIGSCFNWGVLLPFIHSHSNTTGVFRNAFMEIVAEATSYLPKKTADDIIWRFPVVCVVGVLGAIHCEYRQTFLIPMCGIVTFLIWYIVSM